MKRLRFSGGFVLKQEEIVNMPEILSRESYTGFGNKVSIELTPEEGNPRHLIIPMPAHYGLAKRIESMV